MNDLTGRTVITTGAARGLGAEAAAPAVDGGRTTGPTVKYVMGQ
ncbi:hypothetical protein ACFVVX_01350 [Kitasatospora sp. NPDC058170]